MKNLCLKSLKLLNILKMDEDLNSVGEQVTWDFQNVNLTRVPGYGFGIAVSGGRDNPHFANGDPAIAISDVLKAGPAEAKLMINDRIVSANGISLENVDYATAVQVLRECGNSVNLVIKRKINTNLMATAEPQTLKLTITRGKKKEDFGVVLGCHIYIKEVTNSNLIDKSSSVQEGDVVLKINNTNTENISLKEAKKLIDSSKEKVQFVVRRDPNNKPSTNHDNNNQNQRWSSDFPNQPGYIDGISSPRPQWTNQNLYVQPPTRGDYRPPPPPPDDKNNLARLPVARNRGPIMDISLSQLDQPATPLLAGGSNSRPLGSLDEEDAPPRPPPPPRSDEFSMYDDDPLSRRSKAPLLVNADKNHNSNDMRLAKVHSHFSPDPRFIFFQKDGSVGIRLTGGNEVGIFVTAVQPGSPASLQGLQPGDKILKVNEKDMRGVTREEAVLYLLNIQDQVNLIVQHRKEEYDEIVANQRGDSFYIRTHFTYECYGKSELAFHVGEVFHVIDTLYNGVVGSWMVYRMGRNNQEIQKGVIPNKRRAEELSAEQQNQAKKEAASESRGSFFKRRSRRSKSLSKDNWEDVVFADGMSKFPAYERVTLRHPGFIRPVVLFGPLGDVARDKLLKDYPDKYASPQLDNRMDDIPKSQKSSGIIRLSAIKEIIEKGKHAILDITPSAVDRLNYAQFYPIVIFMKAESKHTVKELRSRLAKSSHKSSKKLYDHATKLEKLWSHVFTATIALTSADMWYKKLRETIEKQQQQAIWVSESKPQEVISDDFLFPMTSRLSYASSPESDLDLTSDTRPMSLPDCLTSTNGTERRMVKASSDPSIATQEDASYNAPPPPYSLARPMPEPMSLPGMGHTKGRDSISSPKHSQGVMDNDRTEDFYGSSIRTPHDRYGSLSATEKHLSQANGDVPRPGWPQDPRDHQQLNPDYMNTGTSKSSSLERSKLSSLSPPQGAFDNSSYSSDSFSKYMNNQIQVTPDRRTRDSINSASMAAQRANQMQQPQQQQAHNPYRYTRSTANQWAKPINSPSQGGGRPQQPPPPNKYRQPEDKPVPPSPPPKPSMYHSRLSDGRPVPPPKPALFQQRQQWQHHDETNNRGGDMDHNFSDSKRASQAQENIPISPPRSQDPYSMHQQHNSPSRPPHHVPGGNPQDNDYNHSSSLYSSRNYGSHAEPPPRPQPPPVPENPYQSRHQQPTPGRRPFHPPENGHRNYERTGHGGHPPAPNPNHRNVSNYDMSPYHKAAPGPPNGDGYSPQRPVAHVNGTTSYHHGSGGGNTRRDVHHSYHSSPPPPAPASLLDLSNRENRGSAFELYKKPDSRSSHSMPLHLNCDPNSDEEREEEEEDIMLPSPPRSDNEPSDPTRNVVAVARGTFNHEGGTLTSEETGVSIIVPPGAINEGEENEIYFKVCQDSTMLPPLDKDKGETLLSPLVMCGPHGQKFNIPVELRLPHSAAVNPDSWSFALKSSDATEGAAAEWQNTSLDSGGTFSKISDNFVSVLVDHF